VLIKLLDEFEAIRAAMPLEPRAKKAWRVPEETEAKRIVGLVESWKNKVKRALGAKKGTTVPKFKSLVAEAADIPINLTAQVRHGVPETERLNKW